MIANDTTARRINASHSIQFILSTRELKRRNPDHHDNPRRRQLRATITLPPTNHSPAPAITQMASTLAV